MINNGSLLPQVLNHRKIYVFGELLAQASVQSVSHEVIAFAELSS